MILLSPFAPHICEELWQKSGKKKSIFFESFPKYNSDYIKEEEYEYPVSVNGKLRAKYSCPVDESQENIEREVLELPNIKKWTEGKDVKKIIFVRNKIINVVVN